MFDPAAGSVSGPSGKCFSLSPVKVLNVAHPVFFSRLPAAEALSAASASLLQYSEDRRSLVVFARKTPALRSASFLRNTGRPAHPPSHTPLPVHPNYIRASSASTGTFLTTPRPMLSSSISSMSPPCFFLSERAAAASTCLSTPAA